MIETILTGEIIGSVDIDCGTAGVAVVVPPFADADYVVIANNGTPQLVGVGDENVDMSATPVYAIVLGQYNRIMISIKGNNEVFVDSDTLNGKAHVMYLKV